MKDLIVIGAGPAGVSSALYAKSRGLNVIVLEKNEIGGLIGKVSKVSHYTSAVVNETGEEFAKRLINQLNSSDIPVIKEEVLKIEKNDNLFTITTNLSTYLSEKIVVATGSTPKKLPIDLPSNLKISHWALGYEKIVQGKFIIVNGGSDGAAKEAIYLSNYAKKVHIVQNQDKLLCIDEFKTVIENSNNIEVHLANSIDSVKMNGDIVTEVILKSNDIIKSSNGIELFAMIGQNPNTEIIKNILPLENGYVKSDVITSIKGLYVAGDIRVKNIRQVATAVSDGCIAGVVSAK